MADLTGSLSQLKLIDVLQLLHMGARTGQLELTTEEGLFGEIYLVRGNVTHALYEEWIGEEAVYGLFSWAEGTFRFHTNETTDEMTVGVDTKVLLEESRRHSQDWERIREVIPSSSAIYRLAARPSAEIQLKAEDWSVLTQLDGEKSVSDIAQMSGNTELFTSKVICRLYELGLLELVGFQKMEAPPALDMVEEAFISRIETDMMQAIGPMAPIVIDDCAEQMGHSRSAMPKEAVPEFVERLANEIPDMGRRTKFQEAMLNRMKDLY